MGLDALVPRDLKTETGSQPGRSSKERSGGGGATRAVAPSDQITPGTTTTASASSAATPKKNEKPRPPPAAEPPPTDTVTSGGSTGEVGSRDPLVTRRSRVRRPSMLLAPLSGEDPLMGAVAGHALATSVTLWAGAPV